MFANQNLSLMTYDQKWIYQVHIPRALVGEYLSALKDSKEVLGEAMSMLRSSEVVGEHLTI